MDVLINRLTNERRWTMILANFKSLTLVKVGTYCKCFMQLTNSDILYWNPRRNIARNSLPKNSIFMLLKFNLLIYVIISAVGTCLFLGQVASMPIESWSE